MERNQNRAPGETGATSRCATIELIDPESDAPIEASGKLAPRIDVTITDGTAIVFSDAHHDPRYPAPTAHRAIVLLARHLEPELIIEDGDLIDQPTVSRHARTMFEERPKLVDELACGQQRMREIKRAAALLRNATPAPIFLPAIWREGGGLLFHSRFTQNNETAHSDVLLWRIGARLAHQFL